MISGCSTKANILIRPWYIGHVKGSASYTPSVVGTLFFPFLFTLRHMDDLCVGLVVPAVVVGQCRIGENGVNGRDADQAPENPVGYDQCRIDK